MVSDEELGWLLRALSSSVRRSIIRDLSKWKRNYSDLMRDELAQRAGPGVFNFHLNKLLDLGLVYKIDEGYELAEKGRVAANYLVRIEDDFEHVVGDRSMKKDGIRWRPWEQVKCQVQ